MHLRHQGAQFFHRVVHRVGNGARDVFRHRGLLRQIAFSHRLQFVHQSQNGGLVRIVHALGFLLLPFGFQLLRLGERGSLGLVVHVQLQQTGTAGGEQHGEQNQRGQGEAAEAGLDAQAVLHAFEAFAQRFAVGNDRCLGFTG